MGHRGGSARLASRAQFIHRRRRQITARDELWREIRLQVVLTLSSSLSLRAEGRGSSEEDSARYSSNTRLLVRLGMAPLFFSFSISLLAFWEAWKTFFPSSSALAWSPFT